LTAPRIRFLLFFPRACRYSSLVPGPTRFKTAQFACIVFALSLAGCGSGGVSIGTTSSPDPTFLEGNWLVVGELPFLGYGHPANNSFGTALTFTIIGDQIAAGGSTQIPCSSSGMAGGGVVLTGTVGPDGSFSAQTAATLPADAATLQIKGTVPSATGQSWIGSYTFSNPDPGCPFTSSGPITAVRIADVTGTYSGTTSLSPSLGSTGTAQPVSVSFTLQQGQASSGPAGTQSVNEAVLTGTIAVQGSSCFSTGQIVQAVPAIEGNVLGTRVVPVFTMNDGSHLLLTSNIEDTTVSKLGVIGAAVSGGKCDGQFIESFEASRQ
jgi:hypothetical protein